MPSVFHLNVRNTAAGAVEPHRVTACAAEGLRASGLAVERDDGAHRESMSTGIAEPTTRSVPVLRSSRRSRPMRTRTRARRSPCHDAPIQPLTAEISARTCHFSDERRAALRMPRRQWPLCQIGCEGRVFKHAQHSRHLLPAQLAQWLRHGRRGHAMSTLRKRKHPKQRPEQKVEPAESRCGYDRRANQAVSVSIHRCLTSYKQTRKSY